MYRDVRNGVEEIDNELFLYLHIIIFISPTMHRIESVVFFFFFLEVQT